MCRFGTGARTLLLLLAMSLVEITAMGPSCSTSLVPAARRAVAVLTPFSVYDYIESECIKSEGVVLIPRGKVPKYMYPKPFPDLKMRTTLDARDSPAPLARVDQTAWRRPTKTAGDRGIGAEERET